MTQNLPMVSSDDLCATLMRPEGSLGVLDVPALGSSRQLEHLICGGHSFLFEYEPEVLRLWHATPGAGTWLVELPLDEVPSSDRAAMHVRWDWSPTELRLTALDPADHSRGIIAEGSRSTKTLHADREGAQTVSHEGVSGLRIVVGDQRVVEPPALELWQEVSSAVKLLLAGDNSTENYERERVLSNASIIVMATGFETYCQARFVEVESEGGPFDLQRVLKKFPQCQPAATDGNEAAGVVRPTDIARVLNFQHYGTCKDAFNRGYGLRFGVDLGLSNKQLERVKRLLTYRHRIVHVSPSLGILNQDTWIEDGGIEQPSRALAQAALGTFGEFVTALHDATLALRP